MPGGGDAMPGGGDAVVPPPPARTIATAVPPPIAATPKTTKPTVITIVFVVEDPDPTSFEVGLGGCSRVGLTFEKVMSLGFRFIAAFLWGESTLYEVAFSNTRVPQNK
jgi:hypothetical protein